jgi:hypothetical protein
MSTHYKLMCHASGMYLTEQLPDNFWEWDEVRLIEYVVNHRTEMYETLEPADVLSEIEQAADHWWQFIAGNV